MTFQDKGHRVYSIQKLKEYYSQYSFLSNLPENKLHKTQSQPNLPASSPCSKLETNL